MFHFQSHLILLTTKCYECRKSRSWKVYQKINKTKQKDELRSEVTRSRDTESEGEGEEHPREKNTNTYLWLGCIFSKQSIMQNKSKAGQN